MDLMNWIAGYIGWTVCILSGVAVTASLVGVVINYAWEKIKLAHDLVELQKAIKEYAGSHDHSATEREGFDKRKQEVREEMELGARITKDRFRL